MTIHASVQMALLSRKLYFDFFKHKIFETNIANVFFVMDYKKSPIEEWLKENAPEEYSTKRCTATFYDILINCTKIIFTTENALILFQLRWSDDFITGGDLREEYF